MAVERAGILHFNIGQIRDFLPDLRLQFTPPRLDEIILRLTAVKPQDIIHPNGHRTGKIIHLDQIGHPSPNGHHPPTPPEGEGGLSSSNLGEKIASTNKESSKLKAEIAPIREARLAELAEFETKQQQCGANVLAAKRIFLAELVDTLIAKGDSQVQLKRKPKDPDPNEAARKARAMQERKALPVAKRLYRNIKKGIGEVQLSNLPETSVALFEFIEAESKQLRAATRKASAARVAARNLGIWETYLGGQLLVEGYWATIKIKKQYLEQQLAQLNNIPQEIYLYLQNHQKFHKFSAQILEELQKVNEEISDSIPNEILTGRIPKGSKSERDLSKRMIAHTQECRQFLNAAIPQAILQEAYGTEYYHLLNQSRKQGSLSSATRAVLLTAALTLTISKADLSNIFKVAAETFAGSGKPAISVPLNKQSLKSSQGSDYNNQLGPSIRFAPGLIFYENPLLPIPANPHPQPTVVINSREYTLDKDFNVLVPTDSQETVKLLNKLHEMTSQMNDKEFLNFLASLSPTAEPQVISLAAFTAEATATIAPKSPTPTVVPPTSTQVPTEIPTHTSTPDTRATQIASDHGTATAATKIQNANSTAAAVIQAVSTPRSAVPTTIPKEAPKSSQGQVPTGKEPHLVQLLRGFATSLTERCKPFDVILERVSTGRWKDVLKILMRRESSCIPTAISRTNDWGLLQIHRPTWEADFVGTHGPWDPNIFDPHLNIIYAESIRARYGVGMWATYYGE